MENLWPELRPETAAKLTAALQGGNKIDAIRIYREATTAGLKEAKDAVERGDSLLPKSAPKPAATKKKKPRNWVAIIIGLVGVGLVLFMLYLAFT